MVGVDGGRPGLRGAIHLQGAIFHYHALCPLCCSARHGMSHLEETNEDINNNANNITKQIDL